MGIFTPGTHFYLKNGNYELHKEEGDAIDQYLYKKEPKKSDPNTPSHSIIIKDEFSLGASVNTKIKSQTERKNENKGTFVQYDKEKIDQNGRDFQVDPYRLDEENKIKKFGKKLSYKSNYEGGHLIDHKFSAQGSHTDEFNYVPQIYFYNAPLKEYLVKNSEGYLEIPLFTFNPPEIKVLNINRYDPIPIGILLVPLKNKNIEGMYYFPNNQYNYKKLQCNLKIKKDKGIAKSIAPLFKLRKEIHELLLPAVIYDLEQKNNIKFQINREKKGLNNTNQLIEGMSIVDMNEEDEEVIPKLASDIIHQSNVNISNILEIEEIELMKCLQKNKCALQESFNALGKFLLEYAMANALKSERVSTHSRIMFANIITDFIEYYFQAGENALKYINETYKDLYPKTLKALIENQKSMKIKDLLYFANLYERLSSVSRMYEPLFTLNGHSICNNMSIELNLRDFCSILKNIVSKDISLLSPSQKFNVVNLFLNADLSISSLIEFGYPIKVFKKELDFLRNSHPKIAKLYQNLKSARGEYKASPNSFTLIRSSIGYYDCRIQNLAIPYDELSGDEEEYDSDSGEYSDD